VVDEVDRLRHEDVSAERGRSHDVLASWQMTRSRVRAWRAEPAWIVV